MIKHEIDNSCVNCPSMGLQCQGSTCPYSDHEVVWRECDVCGDADETIYDVNGKELCEECAFNELATFNNMLKYIDSTKDNQIQFYMNWVCGSDIWADKEKVSDKVVEIVRKECLEFPNMLKDEMAEFCLEDRNDFVEFFAEPCGEIDYDGEDDW